MHTPGPWKVGDEGPAILTIEMESPLRGRTDIVVAEIENNGPEDEANARLMAAAPDLLHAAKNLENWLSAPQSDSMNRAQVVDWRAYLRSAIAKAEGKEVMRHGNKTHGRSDSKRR